MTTVPSCLVWDTWTGEAVLGPCAVTHRSSVLSVAFSPDGRHIVSGSDDSTIRIWDAETGHAVGEPLRGHTSAVSSVAFSPDGSRIVSGSEDSTIRIYDTDMRANAGMLLPQLPLGSSNGLQSMEMVPGGWVVSANTELFLWIPLEYRQGLYWPRTRVVIGRFRCAVLDLRDFAYGPSWAKCAEV